ncbi:hypothetical protein OG875_07900 [Streptomyces sp. NBC_01498]|uniref:hypothetical protein n=1 Tax=Streptomyces sp. NBC_01498 TaxID=2975870 RepID=UPI002E7B1F2C|nr:hypothetical protein [Streptomyces sp. NBC_01498]WTL24529.1 hypothetical protein OG875_07900 [Streptomyces sp. NBC_01498]
MPGAGQRGLAAMDSWFTNTGRKVPEKSLLAELVTNIALKPQLRSLISTADTVKVKYKETARGGLAVNIIEC